MKIKREEKKLSALAGAFWLGGTGFSALGKRFLRGAASCLLAAFWLGLATPVSAEIKEVVILSTNDFHSAIDPIPAYWLKSEDDSNPPHLGGAAQLLTLINQIRERESQRGVPVFLFDSGDMFTGMLSKLTKGEALMEMMVTMGYDALGIGNHEFDYGWENFRKQMFRVPFPSLGANIFYKESGIPFSQPHTILERGGVRLGVVGVIGQDARSVVMPSFVADLEFEDPAPAQIMKIVEQGLTLLRGMVQVSGLTAEYDLERPVGERLVSLTIGGERVEPDRPYRSATNSFLAEGGDLYNTFTEAEWVEEIDQDIAEAVADFMRKQLRPIPPPKMGRLRPIRSAR